MKRNLCFILAVVLAWGIFAAPAGAQITGEGIYLTPKLGASLFTGQDRFKSRIGDFPEESNNSIRFAGALAVGYDFAGQGLPIRTEVEFAMRAPFRTESESVLLAIPVVSQNKVTINTLMFNALLDFETDTVFTPYIGGGLGVALIKGENTIASRDNYSDRVTSSHSINKFAWDLTAGGAWDITGGLALDLGYRYFNFGNVDTGSYAVIVNPPSGTAHSSYSRAALHEVMMGLRFSYY